MSGRLCVTTSTTRTARSHAAARAPDHPRACARARTRSRRVCCRITATFGMITIMVAIFGHFWICSCLTPSRAPCGRWRPRSGARHARVASLCVHRCTCDGRRGGRDARQRREREGAHGFSLYCGAGKIAIGPTAKAKAMSWVFSQTYELLKPTSWGGETCRGAVFA